MQWIRFLKCILAVLKRQKCTLTDLLFPTELVAIKKHCKLIIQEPLKGTILGETIGHDKNPSKNQADEIFGMGGDDVVVAGASVDRIKGGSGNDTIWGGTNSGADFGQYAGDTAWYSGPEARYNVVQNVFVKAPKENGKASFDANGMVEVYRVKGDDLVVKIPGVVDKGTVDKANLTSSNGYYSAVIVSDKFC